MVVNIDKLTNASRDTDAGRRLRSLTFGQSTLKRAGTNRRRADGRFRPTTPTSRHRLIRTAFAARNAGK